jgi:hypothetical protein
MLDPFVPDNVTPLPETELPEDILSVELKEGDGLLMLWLVKILKFLLLNTLPLL